MIQHLRTLSLLVPMVAASAVCGAVIRVGDVTISEGTATATVPITIEGGEAISTLTLDFGIYYSTIPISGFSSTGGVFDNAAYGLITGTSPSLPSPSPVLINLGITAPGQSTTANGLIGVVTLDTSSLSAGDSFIMSANYETVFASLSNLGEPVLFETDNGVLSVTSLPEPSGVLLAVVGGGLLIRRKRSA